MKTDRFPDKTLNRLCEAHRLSRRALEHMRVERFKLVQDYAGPRYERDGSSRRQPTNFIELAANIYATNTVASMPRAAVTTPHRKLKPVSFMLAEGLNNLMGEIDFHATLRRATFESFFSMGIIKVGVNNSYQVEIGGVLHDVGQAFADHIDIDDWVHDVTARTWESADFMGNLYCMPLDAARENPNFDSVRRRELIEHDEPKYDEEGGERTGTISRGVDQYMKASFIPKVWLWDIWVPSENAVFCFEADSTGGLLKRQPLGTTEWEGPERGPYRFLGYNDVPGNLLPLPPLQLLKDLNDTMNQVYNKLLRQTARQKENMFYEGAAQDDAERVMNAEDGVSVKVENASAVKSVRFGGADQTNLAFFIHCKTMFEYLGGNLATLGGLGAQAETLGQEQLLSGSASKRVNEMQKRVVSFTAEVMRDLAAYMFYDPLLDLPMTRRVEGTDIEIPMRLSPDIIEGDFLDYNFTIEPYSMTYQSPAQRLQTMLTIFNQVVGPYMPLMAEQGITVDWDALLKSVSRLSNVNEMNEFLSRASPVQGEERGPTGENPREDRMPSVTSRNYTRKSVPGASMQGQDDVLMRSLLGGNPQQSEMDTLTRQAG